MHDNSCTFAGAARLARHDGDADCTQLPWRPHPRFAGVDLRHLVTAADTGGALSAHEVRIRAGACLEPHAHDASLELHEVLRGRGVCCLGDREADYRPGVCGLIPAGLVHSVRANAGEDLHLLATFAPALL